MAEGSKQYVVTGCAGFIGARVAEMLLEAGHAVLGVDNLNAAYDVRMKEYRLGRLRTNERFRFARVDLSDREAFFRAMPPRSDGIDAVFHLAARAGVQPSVVDPWSYVESNLIATLNVLELCRQRAIPKFIMASTSSVYGADAPIPTPETADSSRPMQPYAASKKAAEVMAHAYHHLHGIDVVVLRYFTVYGPAGRPDMSMFRFVQWISEARPVLLTGTGEQSRGFTYIDDIARGTILALQYRGGFAVINLGGHENVALREVIRRIEARVGRSAVIESRPMPTADMQSSLADVTLARTLLNWRPEVGLSEGIDRLVSWYNRERSWARTLQTRPEEGTAPG